MTDTDQLRRLLRGRWHPEAQRPALSGSIDWDQLCHCAEAERVAPLLYDLLRERQGVPRAALDRLHRQYRITTLHHVMWSAALAKVAAALAAARLPAIVLKGAMLAGQVYEQPALRPLADLDVLVRRESVTQVLAVLNECGYQHELSDTTSDLALSVESEMTLQSRTRLGVAVDLHWSLFNVPFYRQALPMDWFWESARPMPGYPGALMLGPEALLLHLTAHLALHHLGEGVLWLCDIAEVLRRYRSEIDWTLVVERARAFHLALALRQTLERAAAELGADVPGDVRDRLAGLRASPAERRAAAVINAGYSLGQRFWIDMFASTSWGARLAYFGARMFPSLTYMQHRYGVTHRVLIPLCYPYRWFLGCHHLITTLRSRGRGNARPA